MSQENKEFLLNQEPEPTDDILKEIEACEIPELIAESENTTFLGEDPIFFTYLKSIPKIRLNLEQDLEFGRMVKLGRETAERLKSDKLSEEQRQTLEVACARGKEAREILISSCLHLVVSLAVKKWVRGTDIMDLIDSGNEGLIKTANRYDPERGFRFITYAAWWAKKEISEEISQSLNVISISGHMLARRRKVNRAIDIIQNTQNGEKPTPDQIKEATGLTKNELQNSQKAKITIVSVEKRVHSLDDEEGGIVMDQIRDSGQSTAALVEDRIFREDFNLMASKLSPKYERILRELTGLSEDSEYDTDPLKQTEVARRYGVSRQRIEQLVTQIKSQIVKNGNKNMLPNRRDHLNNQIL